jgi:hypothetical protein
MCTHPYSRCLNRAAAGAVLIGVIRTPGGGRARVPEPGCCQGRAYRGDPGAGVVSYLKRVAGPGCLKQGLLPGPCISR